MSLINLESRIKSGKVSGIYFLFGEENYDISKCIDRVKKTFNNLELGVNFFNIDKSNISSLSDVLSMVSFFGEQKLIIIKDTGLKFNMEVLENMNKEEVAVLIIEKTVDKRTAEYKYLNKNVECIEFSELKDIEAITYVAKTLKAYGIMIEPEVSEYIVISCGTNKGSLINEFKKIVAYLEDKYKVLTKDIVDKICSKTLNAKTFGVLEMAINKQKEKAIKGIEDLIEQKEAPIGISILLFKQIKQMYMIRLIMEKDKQNGTRTNILEVTGMHPYTYKKLEEASKRYTSKELEKLIIEFDEYDERSKIGEIDGEKGLVRLIMSL